VQRVPQPEDKSQGQGSPDWKSAEVRREQGFQFSASMKVFIQKLSNCRVGFCQREFIRQEDDAQVLRAGHLPETAAVNDQDMFFHQQLPGERFVTALNVQSRKSIESAARSNAAHTGCGAA